MRKRRIVDSGHPLSPLHQATHPNQSQGYLKSCMKAESSPVLTNVTSSHSWTSNPQSTETLVSSLESRKSSTWSLITVLRFVMPLRYWMSWHSSWVRMLLKTWVESSHQAVIQNYSAREWKNWSTRSPISKRTNSQISTSWSRLRTPWKITWVLSKDCKWIFSRLKANVSITR